METTMKRTILLSICLILSTAITISADFNAEIDNEFNIVAGNSETLNLTLTSDKKATVHLSYDIAPDDIGIQIIFSDNDFTFKGTKIVEIDIATHTLLAPNNYVITINYDYEVEQLTGSGGSGGSGTVIVGGGDTDDSTDSTDDSEQDNQTDNQTDEPDDTDDNDSTNEGDEGEKKDGEDGFPMLLLIGIIIGSLIVCILFAWKRRKEENND
jgi:hypothetical protein